MRCTLPVRFTTEAHCGHILNTTPMWRINHAKLFHHMPLIIIQESLQIQKNFIISVIILFTIETPGPIHEHEIWGIFCEFRVWTIVYIWYFCASYHVILDNDNNDKDSWFIFIVLHALHTLLELLLCIHFGVISFFAIHIHFDIRELCPIRYNGVGKYMGFYYISEKYPVNS